MSPQINDETLVAYLDGELPREQSATLEDRIRENEDLRQRVSALRESWNLLGELPEDAPRVDLARSTIEIIALEVQQESRGWRGWVSAYRWPIIAASGLLLFALGALAGVAANRALTARILAQLPTIVEYRSLQNLDSVDFEPGEFLDRLARVPHLIEAASHHGGPALIGDGHVPTGITERRAWVEVASKAICWPTAPSPPSAESD